MPRIWLEDPLGNTYRKHNGDVYIFNGKATSKDRKLLTEFLTSEDLSRVPVNWARVREIQPEPAPAPAPVPTGPIRIHSPIVKKTDSRTRMRLAQRNSTH